MLTPNLFQKKCLNILKEKLQPFGVDIKELKIKETKPTWLMDKEIFIEASVEKFNIWIYDDSAFIEGENIKIRFESPDYETEEGLIKDFIKNLLSLLKNSHSLD